MFSDLITGEALTGMSGYDKGEAFNVNSDY